MLQNKVLSIPDMTESFDDHDEEDLVRAFAKISNNRRASAVTIGEACRQIWRQDTRYKDYLTRDSKHPPGRFSLRHWLVCRPSFLSLCPTLPTLVLPFIPFQLDTYLADF